MGRNQKKCHKCHHRHKDNCDKSRNLNRDIVQELDQVLTNRYVNVDGYIVPNPILSVGPYSVITMVNMALSINDKNTMEQIYIEKLSDFWDVKGNIITPYTVFDEFSKRFFLIARIGDNNYYIAVSKNSNPRSKDDFYKYKYVFGLGGGLKIATDKTGLYVTSFYSDGSASIIYVFDKNKLVDNTIEIDEFKTINTIDCWIFDDVLSCNSIFPCQPRLGCGIDKVILVQAVTKTFDPDTLAWSSDTIRLYHVENLLTTDPELLYTDVKVPLARGSVIVGEDALDVITQPPPLNTPINSSIIGIESWTGSFLSGVLADNSIWTCHVVYSDDGLNRNVSRWYEIKIDKIVKYNKAKLLQVGNADPGGVTNQIYPSINVDHDGNMAIQFTLVGKEQYPAIAYTGRLKCDPIGTVRMPLEIVRGGDIYYQLIYGNPRNYYGYYSGLAIDPSDHKTFWLFNEYPMATNPGLALNSIIDVDGLGSFPGLYAQYSPIIPFIEAPGVIADPIDACGDLINDLFGTIGICRRGVCIFTNKTTNLERAGAIGTIIVQTAGNAPGRATGSPTGSGPTVMVSKEDGDLIIDYIDSKGLEVVNISITSVVVGDYNYGCDWTTYLGAFTLTKCDKKRNAPQTMNFPIPVDTSLNSDTISGRVNNNVDKLNIKTKSMISTNMENNKYGK